MAEPGMEEIEKILLNGSTCVLATMGRGAPHTSLMAYAVAPDCRTLYLVSPRQTRKYRNMLENPIVSILIDTRCDDPLESVRALTVGGTTAVATDGRARKTARELFVDKHPNMIEFIDDPDSVFVAVSIHSFQLLSGVRKAVFVKLDSAG